MTKTLKAIEPEYKLHWQRLDRAFFNNFIVKCDSNGLSYFEGILHITPYDGESLEERRNNVLIAWQEVKSYKTLPDFLQMVKDLLGNVHYNKFLIDNNRLYVSRITPNDITVDNNRYYISCTHHGAVIVSENFDVGYTMSFDFVDFSHPDGLIESLYYLFDTVTPSNLIASYKSHQFCIASDILRLSGAMSSCVLYTMPVEVPQINIAKEMRHRLTGAVNCCQIYSL